MSYYYVLYKKNTKIYNKNLIKVNENINRQLKLKLKF